MRLDRRESRDDAGPVVRVPVTDPGDRHSEIAHPRLKPRFLSILERTLNRRKG